MFKREFLLVGHGSRVPESNAELRAFVTALAQRIDQPIHHCFLELAEPDMWTGITDAAERAGDDGEVVVIPLFLGAAFHLKSEVAGAIARAREAFPHVSFKYTFPLGFHVKLAELLDVRVQAALDETPDALPAEETMVLVVGGGSSDPDSNSSVSRIARVLYERGNYQAVEFAYQRVTTPTTADGVTRCQRLGAKQLVVVPYLLFTGIVHQKTRTAAEECAQQRGLGIIHAQYLGPDHSLLVDVATQRIHEAVEGISATLRHALIDGFPLVIHDEHHHHHHEHGHHHEHTHSHDHSH
jgi:sirohydrochlorin cobaltochelatase